MGLRPQVTASTTLQQNAGTGAITGKVAIVGGAEKSVGVAIGKMLEIYNYQEAIDAFGTSDSYGDLTEMCFAAFKAGAVSVKAVPAASGASPTDGQYQAALDTLLEKDNIGAVVTDSSSATIAGYLKTHVTNAIADQRERIGFVGAAKTASASGDFITLASGIADRYMVVVGNILLDVDAVAVNGGILAASVAQVILGEEDPAMPVHTLAVGAGFGGCNLTWNENSIDALITGGVMPIETRNGATTIVRAVTTDTTTVKELTITRIELYVQDYIRDNVEAKYGRAKNNSSTRSKIQTYIETLMRTLQTQEIVSSESSEPTEVTVSLDSSDKTKINVTVSYYPVWPANFVVIEFSLNL